MIKAQKYDDLIYDVGMHKGEDADYYLKKGFRVIGFEAIPELAQYCREKFSGEISEGRLKIVEGAIVDGRNLIGGKVKFYRNIDNSVWGTFLDEWVRRNEIMGASSEEILVPAVDFTQSLREYGIPHYLKIDIEGMDKVCLRALLSFDQRPDYVSIESEMVKFEDLIDELDIFRNLGYSLFKAVQQEDVFRQREPRRTKEGNYAGHIFQRGSTGLFGGDLPGKWKDYGGIISEYKFIFLLYEYFGHCGKLKNNFFGRFLIWFFKTVLGRPVPGWYDTHAKYVK